MHYKLSRGISTTLIPIFLGNCSQDAYTAIFITDFRKLVFL